MEIKISTEFIKLDAMLKFAGLVTTGGEAKRDIEMGFARVNGNICTQRGRKLYPGDRILFKREEILIK